MNKHELIQWVNKGYSTYKISKELKIGQSTVYRWLKKYNLQTNLVDQYHSKRVCKTCKKELDGKKLMFCSKKCNNHNKDKLKISYNQSKKRATERKLELIKLKGGECEKCGYNQNFAALTFHHKNPKEKSFTIGQSCSQYSWERLVMEVNKCSLLCFNCHMAGHHPNFENVGLRLQPSIPTL